MAGIEVLLILLVIGFVAFAINVLLEAAFLWGASKILKLRKQDFRTALSTAFIYNVLSILFIIICFVPVFIAPALGSSAIALMPLITLGLLLLACLASIVLFVYLIKRCYEVDWKNAILAFILVFVLELVLSILLALPLMIFGTVLWQLGIFSAGSSGSTVTTGFTKLQPLNHAISYKENGDFNTAFMNAAGISIQLTSVSLTEAVSSKSCGSITVNGQPLTSASDKVTLSAGDALTVSAKCPVKGKGDTYQVSVNVEYNAVVGGLTTSHTEKGFVQGPVK